MHPPRQFTPFLISHRTLSQFTAAGMASDRGRQSAAPPRPGRQSGRERRLRNVPAASRHPHRTSAPRAPRSILVLAPDFGRRDPGMAGPKKMNNIKFGLKGCAICAAQCPQPMLFGPGAPPQTPSLFLLEFILYRRGAPPRHRDPASSRTFHLAGTSALPRPRSREQPQRVPAPPRSPPRDDLSLTLSPGTGCDLARRRHDVTMFDRPKHPDPHEGPSDIETSSDDFKLIDPDSGVKRGLKTRHLSMMALAGIIGPGLLIGAGGALANGGPASLLIGFGTIGIIAFRYAAGHVPLRPCVQ